MPTSFQDESNEELVHGAVESALNDFTGELNFPVPDGFPTDAPQQQLVEQQQEAPHYQDQLQHSLEDHHHHSGQPQLVPAIPLFTRSSKKGKKEKPSHNKGRWTEAEHLTFLQGVSEHGKDCTKISAMIPTRTILQVRTHAQK
jgi:SHAQKYF class myb-like DNA-binding protein